MSDEEEGLDVLGARSRALAADEPATVAALAHDVLVSVFAAAEDPTWVRHTVPCVCTEWNELYLSNVARRLHDTLEVDFEKEVKRAVAAAAVERELGGGDRGRGPVVEGARRRPLVVHASSVISWAERRAGSVRRLRLKGGFDGALEDFSARELGALVAAVAPSVTDIFVGPRLGDLYKRPFWESLRDSVVPAGLLRSFIIRGIRSVVSESDVEPLGRLAGSLRELVLVTDNHSDDLGLPRLPEAFFALTELRRLVVSGHPRIRAIPAGISALRNLKELNLSSCCLSSLPKELGELSGLTKLDLSSNWRMGTSLPAAEAFPAALGNMKSLRELDLSRCGLSAVPAFVGELESLEVLDLCHCRRLSSLPKELGNLSRLKKLVLKGNENLGNTAQDEAYPAELGQMKSLRELDLDRCGLTAVPAFVGELESLKVLDLSHCRLSSLPRELGNLSRLTKLDIKGDRSLGTTLPVEEAFPAELGQMKSLRHLCLSSCGLTAVPAFIGELKSLESLDLTGCNSGTFPAFVGELRSLKVLNLSHCRLSSLPKELGELSGLTTLNLASNADLGNAPEAFPAELEKLKSLRDLNLYGCRLRAVPAFVGELRSLRVLNLSHCRLSRLPKALGNLSGLALLDLQGNQNLGYTQPADKAFPAELGQMKSLRRLCLTHCGLRAVPAFVGELESLEVLDLSHCGLSSLPKELGNLSRLTRLDLSYNQNLGDALPAGDAFPAELGNMRSLRELDLNHCGLRAVPAFFGELKSLEALDLSYNTDLQFVAPLDFLTTGCPRLSKVTVTKYPPWTPQSQAHLGAFKARLLAGNPDANVSL